MSNQGENMIKKIFAATILLCILTGCSRGRETVEYITFGALIPLTGEYFSEGLRALNGIQLAKKRINENGGVMGKKLDIIILNDRGCEEYILEQYAVLMERGVTAIIGSSYSSVTMVLAEAANRDGIPVISPTATNFLVTYGRENVFRAIFIDEYQAMAIAHFARNTLEAETALIMRGDTTGWGLMGDVFAEEFERLGGRVIAKENYENRPGITNILVTHMANVPDVIFNPDAALASANLIHTAMMLGYYDTYFLGSDLWDGILSYIYEPAARQNVYYTSPFTADDTDGMVAAFVRDFFIEFSQMPLSSSAAAHSAVFILAEAIETAGSTEWADIVSAMRSGEFDVVTGTISFDENNNPRTNVYVIEIKEGLYLMREKIVKY